MLSWKTSIALAILIFGISTACSPKKTVLQEQNNVIVIVIDALRYNHLSAYGYNSDRFGEISPNIDSFAQESVVFRNAFCHTSWTLPSVSTMFTSLYPSVHGLKKVAKLPEAYFTQAEVFHAHGFRTGGFVSGGFTKGEFGLNQGFDNYDDRWDNVFNLTNKALAWMRKAPERKFFVYIHCFEPHVPYNPPDEYKPADDLQWEHHWVGSTEFDEKYDEEARKKIYSQEGFRDTVTQLYDGEISYVDRVLGRFFEKLKSEGLFNDTLIILTSDHGEALGEHGHWGHKKIYEEEIHVPLIMKLPEKYGTFNAQWISDLVGHIDLFPTINHITNMKFDAYPIQGKSLVPLIQGKGVDSRPIFLERSQVFGLRTGRYKLVLNQRTGNTRELYDLHADPEELINLLVEPNKIAAQTQHEMFKILMSYMRENHRMHRRIKTEELQILDTGDIQELKELEKELKDLGYIK